MQTLLIVSNLLLWLIVILLLGVVYALTRQIGLLHERVAPVGAMMPLEGPKIGEKLPPVTASSLTGTTHIIGDPSAKRTLIYFLSPTCPVCRSLLPVVSALAEQEIDIEVFYASDTDNPTEHTQYADEHALPHDRYLLSRQLGVQLGVSKLPFAVLLDTEGVLKGRGLVNTREHIESLLIADEIDVSTLQEYLGQDIGPVKAGERQA